jgi:outer membrane protein OmpA-like peptidoglycan-associated protein
MWLLIMTFALVSSVALYACVPHIEEDLAAQSRIMLGDLGTPKGWAMVDVDGQSLVLTGEAPDSAQRDRLIQNLRSIPGVTEVINQTVLRVGAGSTPELDSETGVVESADAEEKDPSGASLAVAPEAALLRGVQESGVQDIGAGAVPADQMNNVPEPVAPVAAAPAEETAPVMDIPEPVIPADLPPELARCQRDINQLLSASGTFFGSGSAEVTAESKPAVERIARAVQGCGASFEVAGHTDNSGRTSSNQRLSQARADAIRTELVLQGVPENKVSAVGYGESAPRVSNRTPEGRRINRRIEIRLHKPAAAVAEQENAT